MAFIAYEGSGVKLELNGIPTSFTCSELLNRLHFQKASTSPSKCVVTGQAVHKDDPYLELQNVLLSSPDSSGGRRASRSQHKSSTLVLSLPACASALRAALEAEDTEISSLSGFTALPKRQQDQVLSFLNSSSGAKDDQAMAEVHITTAIQEEEAAKKNKQSPSKVESPAESPVKRRDSSVSANKGKDTSAAKAEHTTASDGSADEFERKRQEQLAKNRSFMQSLELDGLAAKVASANAALKSHPKRDKEKGIGGQKRARPASQPAEPARISLRARKMQPDPVLAAGVDSETGKGIVLAANAGVKSIHAPDAGDGTRTSVPFTSMASESQGKSKPPTGPVPFTMRDGTDESDQHFLGFLRERLPSSMGDGSGSDRDIDNGHEADKGKCLTVDSLSHLQLKEKDVAKLTPNGTTNLAWHPSVGTLLLAAGDKSGSLALWQVDYEDSQVKGEGDEAVNVFDGVAAFSHVHTQYISGLAWMCQPGMEASSSSSSTNMLLSASYDGTIRLLDVHQGQFLDYSKGVPQDMEISALDVDGGSGIAYLADNEGIMAVLDLRAGHALQSEVEGHEKRINCLHIEPLSRRCVVTSGSDAMIRVWDVRKLRGTSKVTPLWEVNHRNSCHAAYWAPDGSQRILTTSYDDTLRIWHPSASNSPSPAIRGAHQPGTSHKWIDVIENGPLVPKGDWEAGVTIKHDNQTGRWVTPFRAVWGAASDYVTVGNMQRGVDIFNAATGKLVRSPLVSEFMTAIPPRMAAHPCCPVLAAATSSGRVHIWR